jgi:hypothetical protein
LLKIMWSTLEKSIEKFMLQKVSWKTRQVENAPIIHVSRTSPSHFWRKSVFRVKLCCIFATTRTRQPTENPRKVKTRHSRASRNPDVGLRRFAACSLQNRLPLPVSAPRRFRAPLTTPPRQGWLAVVRAPKKFRRSKVSQAGLRHSGNPAFHRPMLGFHFVSTQPAALDSCLRRNDGVREKRRAAPRSSAVLGQTRLPRW